MTESIFNSLKSNLVEISDQKLVAKGPKNTYIVNSENKYFNDRNNLYSALYNSNKLRNLNMKLLAIVIMYVEEYDFTFEETPNDDYIKSFVPFLDKKSKSSNVENLDGSIYSNKLIASFTRYYIFYKNLAINNTL